MKKHKIKLAFGFLLLTALLFNWHALLAREISVSAAKLVAVNWMNKSGCFEPNVLAPSGWQLSNSGKELRVNMKSKNSRKLAYLFRLKPSGFILVAADDRLKPVLAFSRKSVFSTEKTPENVALLWLEKDIAARLQLISVGKAPDLLSRNKFLRKAILQKEKQSAEGRTGMVGPFLTSQWGQGKADGVPVFNLFTPHQWSAGCVATAVAQILYYYKWPIHGAGQHKYNEDDAGTIGVNFDSSYYQWQKMLDVYTTSSTFEERAAAGELTFHCGVAVDMDYEQTGSTASTSDVPDALWRYFRFSRAVYKKSTANGFYDDLRREMLAGRPAQLAISTSSGFGHSVDVDGYFDWNGYFHLNMGWEGKNDGWYDLAGSFYVSGYSIVDGAVMGIFPAPEITEATHSSSGDTLFLAWKNSYRTHPVRFQLDYSLDNGGTWLSLGDDFADSSLAVPLASLIPDIDAVGSIQFRVRAYERDKWWGWSEAKSIDIQPKRQITFQIRLGPRVLLPGEKIVVRGNLPPLGGYINSPPFEGPDSLGTYRLTVAFDYAFVGKTLLYRFAIVGPSGVELENQTRRYLIADSLEQVIPVAYFNNQISEIVKQNETKPVRELNIYPNYPNPFHKRTVLRFDLPAGNGVQISIYNVLGEKIGYFPVDKQAKWGVGELVLDFEKLSRESGRHLPAGIYFVRFQSGRHQIVRKILFE